MVKHHVPHTVGIKDCIRRAKESIRHHSTIMRCCKARNDMQGFMAARRCLALAKSNLRAWESVSMSGGAA